MFSVVLVSLFDRDTQVITHTHTHTFFQSVVSNFVPIFCHDFIELWVAYFVSLITFTVVGLDLSKCVCVCVLLSLTQLALFSVHAISDHPFRCLFLQSNTFMCPLSSASFFDFSFQKRNQNSCSLTIPLISS